MHVAFLFIFLIHTVLLTSMQQADEESRQKESEQWAILFEEYAKFYEMPADMDLKEITSDLLASPHVKEEQKELILYFGRRVFIFTYPSDGLKIKGLISFLPNPEDYPLLVYLRGGNRIFGILNPGSDLMCFDPYTVISTTYRGGVSEGHDEFGGEDVNDVKNLLDFIPELESRLSLSLQTQKTFLLGASRGEMEMFLALSRFPEIQKKISKIISLSGLVDMRQSLLKRPDLEEMFQNDFGLIKGVNEEEWINKRDPILTVDSLDSELPILIIQAKEDNRVSLEEGYHMVSKLQMTGKKVAYWEMEGANHCLSNIEKRVDLIKNWLENDSL